MRSQLTRSVTIMRLRLGLDRVPPSWWRVATVFAVALLYNAAVNNAVYRATTPVTMTHHELVRKVLAVGAFALIGFCLERAGLSRLRTLGIALVVGGISYGIEIGQIVLDHSPESLSEHAFDIASGAAGGALGAITSRLVRATGLLTLRAVAVAIVLVVFLASTYEVTYGSHHRQLQHLAARLQRA